MNPLKTKFPGFSQMTVEEAKIFAKIGKDNGDSPEKTLEIISCIDDLLAIQQSAALINQRRGNSVRRKKTQDVMIGRIMQMEQ